MKKNHEIKIKLEKTDMERIKKKAEELGLKPSTYIRMVCLGSTIEVKGK